MKEPFLKTVPSEYNYILKQLSRLRIALGGCTYKEVIFLATYPLYLVVGYTLQLFHSDGEGKYGVSITPFNKRALKHSCYSIIPVKRKSLHFIRKNILILSYAPSSKRHYSRIPKTNI